MPVGAEYGQDLRLKIGLDPKVIFDIGANVGQTVDFYQDLYPKAHVYSFEPIPSTFKRLKNHCIEMSNVSCFDLAFGEKEESQRIKILADANSVLNSLNTDVQADLTSSDEGYQSAEVKVKKLDDFAKENKITHIDLLKIDTEGFEMPVLHGASKLLDSQSVSAIVCEAGFMRANTRNTYFGDINDFLEAKGYALFGIYEMGHLGFKVGRHYGNILYVSKKYRDTEYSNWQV
jgi:FkbM family methyltransferase